ncbi:MAG: response regulator [Anaerolineae bacterium]
MNNFKVLIVDDDLTTGGLLETILQMESYQTSFVDTIEQGDVISLLEREQPHIVILDYHLGSVETLPHLRTIRANATWNHLPVLMTSALDLERDCVRAGASGFILKPFNWLQMTNTINTLRDKFLA